MAADRSWSRGEIRVAARTYTIHRLAAVEEQGYGAVSRLPRSIRVLLENLLRHEDGVSVTRDDIAALASWRADGRNEREIAFRPARVLLQDFTGVPSIVDLAAMRDAIADLGGDPDRINPLRPADLVVDHSVQIDVFGVPDALRRNTEIEFQRNRERYEFLRWGQSAFEDLSVVPPGTGIVHQVNLEYLARVVFDEADGEGSIAFPDTLVGTDSHTTMVNGLGVVGWGVGGIEAEASLLGQPVSMLIPDVVGFKLHGRLPEGATATDLVLTVTQRLREHGVVGKFVEYLGDGLAGLSLADRATVANMSPEYGATIGFFPVDEKTLDYLRFTARAEERVQLVETYCRENALFAAPGDPDPEYTSLVELDLAEVVPSLAGPRRPQDRVPLTESAAAFEREIREMTDDRDHRESVECDGEKFEIGHGSVVIAAITSCTNTSNPAVMLAAGLVARNAVERGMHPRPWVKTSLAPGSQVVRDYLEAAGLMKSLEALRFHVVGYGCTTCIGNSGPVAAPIEAAIGDGDLVAVSVLSGNRNFEGRINRAVRANYLASPPLVVAYALAGRMDIDLYSEPLGEDRDGNPVFLREIWPSNDEIEQAIRQHVDRDMFARRYAEVFEVSEEWKAIRVPEGKRYAWGDSTYILKPPFFEGMTLEVSDLADVENARVLALLGDSVTTDHISPAGLFPADGPAGRYLSSRGVAPEDFNSYGARRGNHEVMMRGTFANIRLRNRLAPGTEGGFTRYLADGGGGEITTIFEASERYREAGIPLVVLAGKAYGTGSSRDWAAKGTMLLGVRAVIAESFERIHRSNLVMMGVLPLEYEKGQRAESLGLTGIERFAISGIAAGLEPGKTLSVRAEADGREIEFAVRLRIDTPDEIEYYRHGGILKYVLRNLAHEAVGVGS
jgi:aconitate hydratase